MTWFKVDDQLHDHHKVRKAGKAAMGVWVLAGSWAASRRNGGFIPGPILSRWGTRADARRLVEAGFWIETSRDGEPGWEFHDWAIFQPAASVDPQVSEARAEAGRRGGIASGEARREASAKQPRSKLVEPPVPVPFPSQPEPTTSPNGEVVPPSRAARETRLTADWQPTDEHRQRATDTGLDIDRESTKFRAHAEEKDRRAKSWNAAFTRWLINAAEYADRDRARGGRPLDRQGEILRGEMARAVAWDTQHGPREIGR